MENIVIIKGKNGEYQYGNKKLGNGAISEVFEGVNAKTNEKVAIKIVKKFQYLGNLCKTQNILFIILSALFPIIFFSSFLDQVSLYIYLKKSIGYSYFYHYANFKNLLIDCLIYYFEDQIFQYIGRQYTKTPKPKQQNSINQLPYQFNSIKQIIIQIDNAKNLYYDAELKISKYIASIRYSQENITKIYDVIEEDTQFLIIMEYCDGGCLLDYYLSSNTSDIHKNFIDIALDIVKGVVFLHEKNIIHRDLKPENIYLKRKKIADQRGNQCGEIFIFKIGDYGLSKQYQINTNSTSLLGTVNYMAPELLDRKYNEKIDIWSLGCIFFELKTKRQYFTSDKMDLREIFYQIKQFSNYSGPEDNDMDKLIALCLNPRPNERLSAQQLLDSIQHIKMNQEQDISQLCESICFVRNSQFCSSFIKQQSTKICQSQVQKKEKANKKSFDDCEFITTNNNDAQTKYFEEKQNESQITESLCSLGLNEENDNNTYDYKDLIYEDEDKGQQLTLEKNFILQTEKMNSKEEIIPQDFSLQQSQLLITPLVFCTQKEATSQENNVDYKECLEEGIGNSGNSEQQQGISNKNLIKEQEKTEELIQTNSNNTNNTEQYTYNNIIKNAAQVDTFIMDNRNSNNFLDEIKRNEIENMPIQQQIQQSKSCELPPLTTQSMQISEINTILNQNIPLTQEFEMKQQENLLKSRVRRETHKQTHSQDILQESKIYRYTQQQEMNAKIITTKEEELLKLILIDHDKPYDEIIDFIKGFRNEQIEISLNSYIYYFLKKASEKIDDNIQKNLPEKLEFKQTESENQSLLQDGNGVHKIGEYPQAFIYDRIENSQSLSNLSFYENKTDSTKNSNTRYSQIILKPSDYCEQTQIDKNLKPRIVSISSFENKNNFKSNQNYIKEYFPRFRKFKYHHRQSIFQKKQKIDDINIKYNIFIQLMINKIYQFDELVYFLLYLSYCTIVQSIKDSSAYVPTYKQKYEYTQKSYPFACILFTTLLCKLANFYKDPYKDKQIDTLIQSFRDCLYMQPNQSDLFDFIKDFVHLKRINGNSYRFFDQTIYDVQSNDDIQIDDPFKSIYFYTNGPDGYILISKLQDESFLQKDKKKSNS